MTTQVITEINSLIQLLEAEIPANPNAPRNQKLARKLEKELASYFDKLEQAFPYSKLSSIYNRYVKESAGSEADNILNPLLKAFDKKIEADISGQLAEVYISGQAEMISWGKTKAGIPIAYEGPPISQAIDWAEKHSATLVKGMNEETKKRLAHTIGQGIENKRGIPGLSRDIRNTFGDMSKYRSQTIARTETASALSQSSLDNMEAMGIEGKEWVTGGEPCEICEGNEAEGVVSRDHVFSSGHTVPPAHPNCACAIAPARIKK